MVAKRAPFGLSSPFRRIRYACFKRNESARIDSELLANFWTEIHRVQIRKIRKAYADRYDSRQRISA